MNKLFSFLIFCVCLTHTAIAQKGQISGTVTDAQSGQPVAGVTITSGSIKGIITDANGHFSIPCSGETDIYISYLGYEPVQQKINCGQTIVIKLVLSANELNKFEIVGSPNKGKSSLEEPASIVKLGETELRRSTGFLMDDAINTNVPGVTMMRRTFSAGQNLNIRGYGNGIRGTNGANSNFDGQGYKVYLNGIPITDAEGITLMDDIDFGSVGSTEILKGPAGTLYGLAIAGAVNMKTIKPQPGKVSLSQQFLAGSYGLGRYTTTLAIGKEKSSILINYGKQQFDGFMPHTASKKDFVNIFGEFSPNSKQSISTYLGYSNSYDERNGELTIGQWDTLDFSGNPAYIKNNAHSHVMTFRTGVNHSWKFNDKVTNNTSIFGTGLISDVSSAGGWTDKSSLNFGFRTTFDTKFKFAEKYILTGITGFESQAQNAQIIGYPMIRDSFNLSGDNILGTIRSNQYIETRTSSAFSDWSLALSKAMSISAGLGYSTMSIYMNNRLYSLANNNPSNPAALRIPVEFRNNYHGMLSQHFGINYMIQKNMSIYGSYRTGYKAPVSSYFFVPVTGEVLTGLKPELGTQLEAGTKGNVMKEKLYYEVAVFYALYKNKMTTIAVPNAANTATSYVYVTNGGEQKNLGVEFLMRWNAYKSETGFFKNISPFLNGAWSQFKYGNFKFQQLSADKKNVKESDFSGKVVPGVPPIVINVGVDFNTKPGLYGNISVNYRDKMYFTSDNLNQAKSYTLVNAKLGYRKTFLKHFDADIYFSALNITSEKYYQMVFVNQLPDAYLPGPNKINYFGGATLKYNF